MARPPPSSQAGEASSRDTAAAEAGAAATGRVMAIAAVPSSPRPAATPAPHQRRRPRRTRCPGACVGDGAAARRVAAVDLLDRLVAHLAALSPRHGATDSDSDDSDDDYDWDVSSQEDTWPPQGLTVTLPAAAVGWLARRLLPGDPTDGDDDGDDDDDDALQDRLARLRPLLPCLTQLRITNAPWPGAVAAGHCRPRVDLRLFPGCRALRLDQVPPGWVAHWPALRRTLRALRIERCGLDDLAGFFAAAATAASASGPAEDFTGTGPDAPPDRAVINFPRLSHVRFSHCELFDTTSSLNLHGTNRAPPPWGRMMHLTSLSLAHNHLAAQRAALAGLRDKRFLTSLDLSHNHLRSFHQAAALAGLRTSLTALNLAGNRIRHVRGLDALAALERLDLSDNAIADAARLAPVARLPRLRELRLRGNPVERQRPRGLRVDVLDLFREQRMRRLSAGATFRALQEALPVLDGRRATLEELKAMRDRTFRRAAGSIVLATVEENWVRVDHQPDGAKAGGRHSTGEPHGLEVQRQRQRRPRNRHTATIEPGDGPVQKRYAPVQIVHVDPTYEPLVSFTLDEVVAALPSCAISNGDTDSSLTEGFHELEGSTMATTNESEEQIDHEQNKQAAALPADGKEDVVSAAVVALNDGRFTHGHCETDATSGIPSQDKRASTSLALISEQTEEAMNITLPLPLDEDEPAESPFDVPLLSPIKLLVCDDEKVMKESAATTTTVDTREDLQTPRDSPPKENSGVTALDLVRTLSPSSLEADQSSSQPSPSPSQLNFRHVTSFGGLLADETMPSFGSPKSEKAEILQKDPLELAEKNTVYCGPRLYAGVNILENLDLYFRAFVFNFKMAEHAVQEEEWLSVSEQYPRIQLWPIDRRYREAVKEKSQLAGKVSPKENFQRVWQEKVVACGHPALRRLTPNRGARYGFHGELLWSAANTAHLKPETIAVHRDVILCLTDMSLYIILDHDSVTEKTKDQKRAFPLPIPRDATFDRAAWPHALAFHPLQTLKSISIGFGFQRLTLRFANTTFPVPDDFTYVLLTSNKSSTVALLKDIQTLANEAKTAAALAITECEVLIDNDDRHVLDGLGAAVAPDAMGSVLHYQVLAQRWSRGERGTVRRVCVVTDARLYLLDEDYAGDGSESIEAGPGGALGATTHRVVDAADLRQVTAVLAADADPVAITISISPPHRLQRTHNWRLVCRDRGGAERLVEDVRKAVAQAAA